MRLCGVDPHNELNNKEPNMVNNKTITSPVTKRKEKSQESSEMEKKYSLYKSQKKSGKAYKSSSSKNIIAKSMKPLCKAKVFLL